MPCVCDVEAAAALHLPPQVRTVSAKALGAMVKGMGESCFDDLLPWLMETLASEQSSVDRSGAAQGRFFYSVTVLFLFHSVSIYHSLDDVCVGVFRSG